MNISKKKLKEKDLYNSLVELDELYKLKHKIKSIKLDKPIKHGYVRYLVFHQDALKRKDYLKLKEIVDFLGIQRVYSQKKDFLMKNKVEKHAYVKSIRDPRYTWFPSESARQKAIKFINDNKKYLTPCTDIFSCGCSHVYVSNPGQFVAHYRFIYPWLLQEVTEPHYLTHYTPVDSELESKIKRLNDYINRNHYWEKAYPKKKWDSSVDEKKRKHIFLDEIKEVREALKQEAKIWQPD